MAVLLHQLDPEVLRLARHHHGVRGAADEHLQMGGREGLGQVVPGAGAERLDAAGDAGVAGHHHDDRVLIGLERGLEDLQPGDLRHVQVHEDDVEFPAAHGFERLLPASDQRDIVPVHLEHAGAALPQGALVVDDEHPNAGLDLAGDGKRIAGCALGSSGTIPVLLNERISHPAYPPGGPRYAVGWTQTRLDAASWKTGLLITGTGASRLPGATAGVTFLPQSDAKVKQVRTRGDRGMD